MSKITVIVVWLSLLGCSYGHMRDESLEPQQGQQSPLSRVAAPPAPRSTPKPRAPEQEPIRVIPVGGAPRPSEGQMPELPLPPARVLAPMGTTPENVQQRAAWMDQARSNPAWFIRVSIEYQRRLTEARSQMLNFRKGLEETAAELEQRLKQVRDMEQVALNREGVLHRFGMQTEATIAFLIPELVRPKNNGLQPGNGNRSSAPGISSSSSPSHSPVLGAGGVPVASSSRSSPPMIVDNGRGLSPRNPEMLGSPLVSSPEAERIARQQKNKRGATAAFAGNGQDSDDRGPSSPPKRRRVDVPVPEASGGTSFDKLAALMGYAAQGPADVSSQSHTQWWGDFNGAAPILSPAAADTSSVPAPAASAPAPAADTAPVPDPQLESMLNAYLEELKKGTNDNLPPQGQS